MPRTKYDDRTHIKNFKKEKVRWRKAAKDDKLDLSTWIRDQLNTECDTRQI